MADDLIQYEELVQRHDAAYSAFKTIYVSKNPPPVLERVHVSWFDLVVLFMLVLASIAVSGSRTIPEFGGGFIGWSAFVMLEVAMIAYAFWHAQEASKRPDAKPPTSRLTRTGIAISFAVIISANLHHTLLSQGVWMPSWVNTTIYVALAVSAPSLALIAGDRFGHRVVLMAGLQHEAKLKYEAALSTWMDALNKSWDSNKSRWGVRVEVHKDAPPASVDVNLRKLPSIDRPTPKMKKAIEWLEQHPEHIDTESRQLAEMIGVSHTLANDARKIVKFGLKGQS